MTVCGEKVTGVCVMGKCPHIKRCCPVVWDKYGRIKPQTNEEWFSGMHTEAKAEWLADHMKCSKCPQQNRCNGYHGGCVALMLEWLKEKHND